MSYAYFGGVLPKVWRILLLWRWPLTLPDQETCLRWICAILVHLCPSPEVCRKLLNVNTSTMNKPLNIVKNPNGTFQEVDGRPMILVFDANEDRAIAREKKNVNTEAACTSLPGNDLVFIKASGSQAEDKITRKLIRAHVMKKFRREQKQRRKENNRVESSPSIMPREDRTFPTSLMGSSFRFWQLGGRLDPFAHYPIPMQPHMYRLVYRYLTVVVKASYPKEELMDSMSSRPVLFELAMSCPAFFHMILCTAALYVDVLSGQPESPEAIAHKTAAISSINQALEQDMNVSDAIIGAVSYLAKVEFILGNYSTWNIHMNGLITMIKNRGGFQELNKSLQGKVCMADLVGCQASDLPPRFPFFDNEGDLPSPSWPAPAIETCIGFRKLVPVFSLGDEIIAILENVQSFTNYIMHIRPTKVSSNISDIDHMAASLRYRLLSCATARQTQTQKDVISECCRLGALTHLKVLLQAFRFRNKSTHCYKPTDIILAKLKSCIELMDAPYGPGSDAIIDLMIWVLFVCSIASSRTLNGSWFVAKLSSITNILQISTLDRIKDVLKMFLWTEALHDGLLSRLWSGLRADASLN